MSEPTDSLGVARDNLEEQNAPEQDIVGVLDVKENRETVVPEEVADGESLNTDTNEQNESIAVVDTDEKTLDQSSPNKQSDAVETEENLNGKDVQEEQETNEEAEATTTVQFIAVSAEEHQRMVTSGELPESVQGADVHMQIPGAEAQQVRLIAVDSNGVPVTETAILQAAAEQAGIVFITKDDDDNDVQITIDEAMKLSEGGSGARHIITATTAAALLEQQNKPDKSTAKQGFKDGDGNDSEDDGDEKSSKPSLQIRVYSQKDSQLDESNFESTELAATATTTALVTMSDLSSTSAIIAPASIELADESVYEFQEPPTGKDSEEGVNKIAIIDPTMFKKSGPRRVVDKTRDRRKIYQCKECAFYSHRHSNLIRHIKIHTDERPYQCHLCERAFRTNTLLRNHINTHTGVKPYKCAEVDCDMAFVTSGELTRHIRYRHTHEKPFKCTLCDYASVEISKLRRHFRSHTGERPYSCDDCGKAFADSFHLKRHRMSHTGEKPYECPECNQRFTQRGSVKMHIMQQHLKNAPKFACEICHTLLGRKSDLNVHMRKQHAYQETPIQCRYCGELFHDRWNLMKHQKTHRSYGSRQTPNGKERRKRPWDGDDDDDEYEDEVAGVSKSKIPMIREGQNQVTVYVENDMDEMYEEDEANATIEDIQTENDGTTLVSVSTVDESNLASVMLSGENEPVLLMRPETDQAMIVASEQSSTIVTSVADNQVTAVISESGEIVHLVDSSIMQSLDQEHSQEEKDDKIEEADEDETKLQIADGDDDLMGSSLPTTE